MTPKLILGNGQEYQLQPLEPYELRAKVTIFIAPLEVGRVYHDVSLSGCITPVYGPIILLGNQGLFLKRALWVEVSMLEDGLLQTSVFNMGNERIRIGKGDCISQLIWMAHAVYHTLNPDSPKKLKDAINKLKQPKPKHKWRNV